MHCSLPEDANTVIMKIVSIIMKVAPIGPWLLFCRDIDGQPDFRCC